MTLLSYFIQVVMTFVSHTVERSTELGSLWPTMLQLDNWVQVFSFYPVKGLAAVIHSKLDLGQQQQIKHASCGYVAHEEGQVTPTCADLAKNCGGSHRSWVTIASWDLKWCRSKVGGWWNWWTLKRNQKYGGCCWNSYYRTRASQCSWTESTGWNGWEILNWI